jgi:hypothetical protein
MPPQAKQNRICLSIRERLAKQAKKCPASNVFCRALYFLEKINSIAKKRPSFRVEARPLAIY